MKKFVAFLITILLIGSIAFLALGNDMFMLLVISQNKNKAAITLTEEVAGFNVWSNYDLKVVKEEKFNNEVITNEITFKSVTDNNELAFVAQKKTIHKIDQAETSVTTKYYYKENNLYKDVDGVKTSTTLTSTLALTQVFGTSTAMVFLVGLDPIDLFESANSFSAGVNFSLSPFYVGQNLKVNYEVDNDKIEVVFKFDLFRNYRGLSYQESTATTTLNLNVHVLSINKAVQLNFPANFDAFA